MRLLVFLLFILGAAVLLLPDPQVSFDGLGPVEDGRLSNVSLMETAVFAGGCFWCMEAAFEALDGVGEVVSGYTGGRVESPTYAQVISGNTGHVEAVLVNYDAEIVSYTELVDYFWRNIDPFDSEGQFADKGSQYHTVIFFGSDEERSIADDSKSVLQSQHPDETVHTQILPRAEFFVAEEYHQDYYKKKSSHYKLYELGSGRKNKLKELWGSADNE